MKINFDTKFINQLISDAFIKSDIGERIAKTFKITIEDCLEDEVANPLMSVMRSVFKEAVRDCLEKLLRERYADEILELVQSKVDSGMKEKFVAKILREI